MKIDTSLLIFFFLTLVAEIMGTIGGFGSSVFFVSLSQFFFDFKKVLALTGLLHIFSNASKIFLFRKSIEWKLVASIGISSIALAIAGAYLDRFHLEDHLDLTATTCGGRPLCFLMMQY